MIGQNPAVVILHYGELAMTVALAQSMLDAEPGARIWVLDNAAPEPYPPSAPAFWQRVPENLFWAGALQYALDETAKAGLSHLWFLNNDIRFATPGPYVSRIMARLGYFSKRCGHEVGIYSPCVQRNPYHAQMAARSGIEGCRVSYVDGIAMLLNLECVASLGGLDCSDNFVGYGVDVWLSLRAHQAGWPVVVDHKIVLKHNYHATAATLEGFMSRAADLEQAFMSRRLGKDWRERLKGLQNCEEL